MIIKKLDKIFLDVIWSESQGKMICNVSKYRKFMTSSYHDPLKLASKYLPPIQECSACPNYQKGQKAKLESSIIAVSDEMSYLDSSKRQ